MHLLLILSLMCMASLAFAQDGAAFFNKIAGKVIIGKTKDGATETLGFSRDGQMVAIMCSSDRKDVALNRGSRKHLFVKMVDNMAIYQVISSYPVDRLHYEGFMIKDDQTVMVMGPGAYGQISDHIDKVDSIDEIVSAMPRLGVPYTLFDDPFDTKNPCRSY
jgi:hypothetical protein